MSDEDEQEQPTELKADKHGYASRDPIGKWVKGMKPYTHTPKKRGMTFRQYLRQRVGESGETMWEVLIDVAEGKPWVPTWTDKRTGQQLQGPVQVPSAADRVRAAERILDGLHGKPVPETDINKAEAASTEMEAIKNLSDDELDRRIRAVYAGREAARLPTTTAVPVVQREVEEEIEDEFGSGED